MLVQKPIALKFHQLVDGLSKYFETTVEHAYLKNKARVGALKVNVCLGPKFYDRGRPPRILAPPALDNPILSNSTLMEHKKP